MTPLGGAVLTSAGRLPYKGIIHVAGINLLWRSSEFSIRRSVQSALAIAQREGYSSIAFPLIGSGSGGRNAERSEGAMRVALSEGRHDGEMIVVRYKTKLKGRNLIKSDSS